MYHSRAVRLIALGPFIFTVEAPDEENDKRSPGSWDTRGGKDWRAPFGDDCLDRSACGQMPPREYEIIRRAIVKRENAIPIAHRRMRAYFAH